MSLALGAAPTHALAAGGCGAPANSALNQYCESIPTARGGQRPNTPAPSVGSALPPGVAQRIGQSGANAGVRSSGGRALRSPAARQLLNLPAPVGHVTLGAQRASVSGSSLPLWLILVLAVAALLLAAAAAYRWRRGHSPEA